jgi:hypothetical protein
LTTPSGRRRTDKAGNGGRGREGKEGRESIHNTYMYIPHQNNLIVHPPSTLAAVATVVILPPVGTLKVGYIHNVPLPRVSRIQSASLATLEPSRCIMVGHTPTNTYYSQVPRVPTWSNLTRSLLGFGRITLLPFFPVRLM